MKALLAMAFGIVPQVVAGEMAGTVVTPGRMIVNNLAVQGSATVQEGAILKTVSTAARVELAGGGVVSLDAHSEALVKRAGLELRQGKGMVANEAGGIEAFGFTVNGAAEKSQVLVAISGRKVEVAAVRGVGRVRNGQGVTLAMVHGGKPLSFEPGSGTDETLVTGRLNRLGAKYMLKDELTALDFELRGSDLAAYDGVRVQAGGMSQGTADGASQVVLVSRLNRLEASERTEEAAGTNSRSSTAAKTEAAKTGMSAGTKIGLAALAFGGLATAIAVPLAMSN